MADDVEVDLDNAMISLSIRLGGYDDLFSSFDNRPWRIKTVSEIKKVKALVAFSQGKSPTKSAPIKGNPTSKDKVKANLSM